MLSYNDILSLRDNDSKILGFKKSEILNACIYTLITFGLYFLVYGLLTYIGISEVVKFIVCSLIVAVLFIHMLYGKDYVSYFYYNLINMYIKRKEK